MRTGDVAAMQACQLQKVRDEQTRCKFTCVISVVFLITRFTARGRVQYILCGRRLLLSDMQFFTILHTLSWSRKLLSTIQVFTILQIERGRLIIAGAMRCFTILHNSSGRGRLILSKQIFTISKASRGLEGASSNTLFHHTAHIGLAQEAVSG